MPLRLPKLEGGSGFWRKRIALSAFLWFYFILFFLMRVSISSMRMDLIFSYDDTFLLFINSGMLPQLSVAERHKSRRRLLLYLVLYFPFWCRRWATASWIPSINFVTFYRFQCLLFQYLFFLMCHNDWKGLRKTQTQNVLHLVPLCLNTLRTPIGYKIKEKGSLYLKKERVSSKAWRYLHLPEIKKKKKTLRKTLVLRG